MRERAEGGKWPEDGVVVASLIEPSAVNKVRREHVEELLPGGRLSWRAVNHILVAISGCPPCWATVMKA